MLTHAVIAERVTGAKPCVAGFAPTMVLLRSTYRLIIERFNVDDRSALSIEKQPVLQPSQQSLDRTHGVVNLLSTPVQYAEIRMVASR